MTDLPRYRFTDEEWSTVAAVLGNLGGVEYVDLEDDGFELVGIFDPDLLDEFRDRIRPAPLEAIRAHIENRLARVRGDVFGGEVVRNIGDRDREIAKASQHLLDLLPPIFGEGSNWPGKNPMNSTRFRKDLQEVHDRAQANATQTEMYLRKPASRPTVPQFRIDYWEYLMRLWTDVLHKPATNSPGGDIARFIDAASAPARDILDPSQNKAFQFVKEHRARIWQKTPLGKGTFRLVKSQLLRRYLKS